MKNRYWILESFIDHLHDDTRWPAKYYKDVLKFYHGKEVETPEELDYPRCCHKYAKPKYLKKLEESGCIVTVDAVMYHLTAKKWVLIKRGAEPYKGMYALPGGIVERDETLASALEREIEEETNLTLVACHLVSYKDDPKRDPRGRTITFYYSCFVNGEPKAGDDAKSIHLLSKNEIIPLSMAFDHKEIIFDVWRQRNI